MSNDDTSQQPHDGVRQHSAVADVSFTTIAANDDRKGAARGESFKHGRWSTRGERFKDKLLTPPRSLSSRKSEDTQRDSDGTNGSAQKRQSTVRSSMASSSTKSATSQGKRRLEDNNAENAIRLPNTQAASRLGSSKSTESSTQHNLTIDERRQSKSPSMDPAQLVQMALNLSESRRRHSSNPAPSMISNVPAAFRQTSAEVPLTIKSASSYDSYGEEMESRFTGQRDGLRSGEGLGTGYNTDQYHFSPATLVRAEKARRYFELADKHRRLLLQLAPLPHSNDRKARKRAFSGASRRSSHHQDQDYKNEDSIIAPEQFQDMDKVETWLTQVEACTKEERTSLPVFEPAGTVLNSGSVNHKRSGTADTVITRPDHGWSISPAELLADTYWTEQGSNKIMLDKASRGTPDIELPRSNQYSPSSRTTEQVTPDKARHKARHLIPLSAANRLRHNRFTKRNRSVSGSSDSSVESRKNLPTDVNIGPLQRHMDEMIRKDAHDELSSPPTKSPDHWDAMHIRHRSVDHHHHEPNFSPKRVKQNGYADGKQKYVNIVKAIPSSPESSYPTSPTADRASALVEEKPTRNIDNLTVKMPTFHSKSRDHRDIDTLDFVYSAEHDPARHNQGDGVHGSRLNANSLRPATFHRHKTADSVSSSIHELVNVRSKTDSIDTSKEPGSAVTRFLRGGKLGEIVRSESSKFGNRIRGKDRHGDEALSDVSAQTSDTEALAEKDGDAPERNRSRNRYHIRHLPSFRSPQARDTSSLQPILSDDSSDHIGRQQAELRDRNRSPRFERLAPPRINLPEDDRTSRTRGLSSDKSGTFGEQRKTYGFLNPALRKRSRSHSKSRSEADRGRLTTTAPSAESPRPTRDSRHWSISDQRPTGMLFVKSQHVTSRDVARVRALLLASGIKAREISRRLALPSAETPGYLRESAEVCAMSVSALQKRPQREEPAYAVQLLASFVDEALGMLGKEYESYKTEDLQALITRQDRLKARVSEELTELVHSAGDQADAFNIELSTQATLRTKQVDDAVDAVLRLRRRQFRVLRIAAFKLLEWTTLSLLWLVWFVVVCFKTAQRSIVCLFRLLRWLFTF